MPQKVPVRLQFCNSGNLTLALWNPTIVSGVCVIIRLTLCLLLLTVQVVICLTLCLLFRKKIAEAKVPLVNDYVNDVILENGVKFLLFAHHHSVLDALEKNLQSKLGKNNSYVRIDGKTNPHERHRRCDKFQTDEKCQVSACTAAAALLVLHCCHALLLLHCWCCTAAMRCCCCTWTLSEQAFNSGECRWRC